MDPAKTPFSEAIQRHIKRCIENNDLQQAEDINHEFFHLLLPSLCLSPSRISAIKTAALLPA